MFELYGDMVAFTGNLGKLPGGTLGGVWVVGRVDVENKGGVSGCGGYLSKRLLFRKGVENPGGSS